MTIKQQIEQRYGSFELSHDKNVAIVSNIEEFIDNVAIKFAEWQNGFRDDSGELNGAFDDMNWDELFAYFKENVYGKH